jgi:hypothetical protein
MTFYQCQHCVRKFRHMSSYVKHYKIHKNIANISFPCPFKQCNAQFINYNTLKSHVNYKHKYYTKISQIANRNNINCKIIDCNFQTTNISDFIFHLKEHLRNNI